MTVRAETATPGNFAEVLPLFATFRNPPIGEKYWRRLFHYAWPCADRQRGFLLRDGARVVGFYGTILDERTIGGRVEKFANLTSWVTLPDYRNHSLRLFEAVAAIEDRTLTCFTALPATYPLYRRFGFADLEDQWIVTLPTLSPTRPDGWLRGRIITDLERIQQQLEEPEATLVRHLASDLCHPLLVTHRGQQCLVFYTRTKGRRFHFSRIHYLGNREVFLACLDHLRWRMALANRALLIAIDARLLDGEIPRGARLTRLAQRAVYRSRTLQPAQIDSLYTELVLLPL